MCGHRNLAIDMMSGHHPLWRPARRSLSGPASCDWLTLLTLCDRPSAEATRAFPP